MNKKNNQAITVISIIVLIVIVIIIFRNGNRKIQPQPQPLSQSDMEINQAVASDTTQSIADNLNGINMGDTTDADLIPVDQELAKL